MDDLSRRRALLLALGLIPVGSGLATGGLSPLSGDTSPLSGTGTTTVTNALRIDSVAAPTAPNATVIRSGDLQFRVAESLRQGESLPIEVTIVNEAGGPALAQANIQSPDGIVPRVSIDDTGFDTTDRATLTIQLQAINSLAPDVYTTTVTISPIQIQRGGGLVSAKADVHFLLDKSKSTTGPEINTIKSSIKGFFAAVEQTSDGKRFNLAVSVSEFGGATSDNQDRGVGKLGWWRSSQRILKLWRTH